MTIFRYATTVRPEWIDYNGHMQDAYYGLIFSYAVDGIQDNIGFDASYREATGCTIYLLEDHKFFLKEVKEGAKVTVETRVLNCDASRFHLHMTMLEDKNIVAICEAIEIHVNTQPNPHGTEMPIEQLSKLQTATIGDTELRALKHRSRHLSL